MNALLSEYLVRLRECCKRDNLVALYEWFWERPAETESAIEWLNTNLGLSGDCALKFDLPTIGVGGFEGLVVLGVNPGWRADLNAKEDGFCRRSKEDYVDLKLGFFRRHPQVVGLHIQWWAQALSFAPLLDAWRDRFPDSTGIERWEHAHISRLVGGWELIPFHSSPDGVTPLLFSDNWFHECALESMQALERLKPKMILIASKAGSQIAAKFLHPELQWSEALLGNGRLRSKLSRAVTSSGLEIIALSRQLSAPRNSTNDQLITMVQRMRGMPGRLRA